jgi:LysR family transcriptional regulator, regulator for bpeEF and oprC
MVQKELAEGSLRPVLDEWTTDAMSLHVVYPPNRHLSAKLRIFVDWIAEIFGKHELMRRR